MQTHYDNLKISRDADADEIRRAYRRLSKQYHPDLNQNPDAHRIMQLINQAYDVLSDPIRRAEHDKWIDAQRAAESQNNFRQPEIVQPPPRIVMPKKVYGKWLGTMIAACVALTVLLVWQMGMLIHSHQSDTINAFAASETLPETPEAEVAPPETLPEIAVANSNYIRPITAPNGNPLPPDTAYVDGYPLVKSASGRGTIIADNVKNSSDVLAQLFEANGGEALRTFFIVERGQIALNQLDSGDYVIRYRQLDGGEEVATEQIHLDAKQPEATIYLQRGMPPIYP